VQEGYISDGSAWTVIPSGGTELAYAQITSNQTTSNGVGSPADITGLSVTVTVGERPLIFTFNGALSNNTSNNIAVVFLVVDGTIEASAAYQSPTSGASLMVYREFRVTGLTPGTSHTFKAQFSQAIGGTATVYGDPSNVAQIQVRTT
jgi:hypothetical protein